jgi:hypothetical protein
MHQPLTGYSHNCHTNTVETASKIDLSAGEEASPVL